MKLQLQIVVTGNGQQQLNATAKAVANVGVAARGTNDQLSSIIKTIRDIRTIIAVVESARMFSKIITEGIQFNALLETSKFGLTALITTFTDMTDVTGRHLDMTERYNHAQGMAVDLQHRMKIAALQTTLQYSDLLDVMQRGLPFMLKYFHDANGSVVSNQKIVNFTTAFSQGAQAFGLGPEEIGTNIQRLLQGTADARHARFAYALLQDIGGNPQQIKEQLRLWEQQGVLYEKLTEKVMAFKRAGQDMMGTFSGTWSNFKDALQQALGEGTTGATRELRDLLKEITNEIVSVDANGKATFNEDFVTTVTKLATAFTTLARGLAEVAKYLATIGAYLVAPNMKNLMAALAGAFAGGVVGGVPGALVGGAAMYFSASVDDSIAEEARMNEARRAELMKKGIEISGRVSSRTGSGIMADQSWGIGGQESMDRQLAAAEEDMSPAQQKFFENYIKGYVETKMKFFGDTDPKHRATGHYYQQTLDRMKFLSARKDALDSPTDGIDVKSKALPGDPEEMRKRALALEKYREALDHVIQTLSKNELKRSFDSALHSIDAQIEKTKDGFDGLIAKAKANDTFAVSHVNPFKDRDPWHLGEETLRDTSRSEHTDPFPAIDLEKRKAEQLASLERERAELKALNDYGAQLEKIADMEQKLKDLKAQAALSKTKPEDAAKEKEAAKAILEAKAEAEKDYAAARANANTAQEAALGKARLKAEADTDSAVNKIFKEADEKTIADAKEAWLQHYENRLQMERDATQRTIELYQGLFANIKQGMHGIVDSLMNGGKSNPFQAIYESFKSTWSNYMASIVDIQMKKLTIIASGEHKEYGYTRPGETGPNDPGGLPKYATPGMTKDARVGMAGLNAAMALYGLYQGGQGGMTRSQGAVQGAMTGASIGAAAGAAVLGVGAIVGAIIGAIVGAIAGALLGKPKIGYNVTVSGGKIQVSGQGSANSQDVSAAMQAINKVVEDTSNNLYGILFSLPASVLQAIGSFKPGDMKMDKGRWFNGDSLKLFLQTDVPKMVFDSFAPALQGGLEALGVTKAKLAEIFKRTDDPSFDPKDFIAKLQDYVNIITGLQEVMKLMGTAVDDGSGWDARAELAHKTLNKSAYDQISEIDQKVAGISGLFGGMSWDEQIAAGKQVLSLAQQRYQIEMQALEALRSAWLNIESNVKANKDSIAYSELTDPNDPAGTAKRQSGYWRSKAFNSMTSLVGLMNNPDATIDDVNKYAQAAQDAAMNLYQVMKSRYEDEMQLVKQIDQAVKDVTKGFEDSKFGINFDQARLGVDADGNPIYDKKKQADMILGQQRDLFDQLRHATDPAEVARISGEIQKNASQLYELWGKTPEAAKQVLAQLTDAEQIAKDTLKGLREAAEAEAQKYKDAATEALNILTATADIANAVIAGMQHKIESLDPNAYHNLDIVLASLSTTTDTTTTSIDDLGSSADGASRKLDMFGDNLLQWSGRFHRDSEANGNSSPVHATSNAATSNGAPVIILNGSMAAVADEVEVRIGNKIFKRAVNTMQRQAARSGSAF